MTPGEALDTVQDAALTVAVVANVSPLPVGDVTKPDSVIAPAAFPLTTCRRQLPSFAGACSVNAPPFSKNCCGPLPQSTV